MAEKNSPRYTIKHIDGVMHLTVVPEAEANVAIAQLRVQPQVVEPAEK
jgi:hypothetical protein